MVTYNSQNNNFIFCGQLGSQTNFINDSNIQKRMRLYLTGNKCRSNKETENPVIQKPIQIGQKSNAEASIISMHYQDHLNPLTRSACSHWAARYWTIQGKGHLLFHNIANLSQSKLDKWGRLIGEFRCSSDFSMVK